MLYGIIKYINEDHIPEINNLIDEVEKIINDGAESMNQQLATAIDTFTTMIADTNTANQTLVTQTLATVRSEIATSNADNRQLVEDTTTLFMAIIDSINNKTGPVDIQRTTLTAPYTLQIDPVWPTNQPVSIALKQDATGGRTVTLGANITGPLNVDSAPNGVTEFSLVPQGDGTWQVNQTQVFVVKAKYANGPDAFSHVQSLINRANSVNGAVKFATQGVYSISNVLEDVQRLIIGEGVVITATAAMPALLRTRESSRVDGGYITGKGTVDGNTNAGLTIHARNFLGFHVDGFEINGGNAGAIKLGSVTAVGRSAEAVLKNLRIVNKGATVVAGSRAILSENSGDHSFSQIFVMNYEGISKNSTTGNAVWKDVHGWCEPSKGALKVGWEEYSNSTKLDGCFADSPTDYGFHLYGYGNVLVGCTVYLNPNVPQIVDNTVVAIRFETVNSIATIIGPEFTGGGSGATLKRIAVDIQTPDGVYDLINFIPGSSNNVASSPIQALYGRFLGINSRDRVKSTKGLEVDSPTALLAGLSLKVGGKDRWKLVLDGGAESGANAGSGVTLNRYDDAGNLLGTAFYVARGSGTFVWQTTQSIQDGKDIALGSGTGTKIGTNAVQKMGFYGATPVVQPSGIPAVATDPASTQALVNTLRAKLFELGLIA